MASRVLVPVMAAYYACWTPCMAAMIYNGKCIFAKCEGCGNLVGEEGPAVQKMSLVFSYCSHTVAGNRWNIV